MYIAAGQRQKPQGTKFWCQQKPFVTSVIWYKFKTKSIWSLILYIFFFMILYMYIAPGQGLTTPWGRKFDVNRNILPLRSFVASSKKSLWCLILYNSFRDFVHVYSPGPGAGNPQRTRFWRQQKCFVNFIHLLQVSNKNVLEFWF